MIPSAKCLPACQKLGILWILKDTNSEQHDCSSYQNTLCVCFIAYLLKNKNKTKNPDTIIGKETLWQHLTK